MEVTMLPSFIAGTRIDPDGAAPRIRSLDGTHELVVAETSPVLLRKALRHADGCQSRLAATTLEQRIEAARFVMHEYDQIAGQASLLLARFRGLSSRDARWMCQVNLRWAEQLDVLASLMFGGAIEREVECRGRHIGALRFQSKGKACLFSSSTMDGPAAVVALCHAMVSGSHLLLRPSFRDPATHLAFEIMYRNRLDDYAQLVRWRSDAADAPLLNRQLLANVGQAVIFSSNETFRQLLDGAAAPGSNDWDALHTRCRRYGTGLPLAVVTPGCDLESAARDLVEGARLGGGRFCLSTGPVLVDRSIHEELAHCVVERAKRLRPGSPLDEATDLSSHEAENVEGLRAAVRGFGGTPLFGEIRQTDMDVIVLADVPTTSSALYREVPGPVLSLIPVTGLEQATEIASSALRRNGREAWTAIAVFGSDDDFAGVQQRIDSFRYLRGGVVAQVKLLLPHQGSYFALDLMRRVSVE